MAQFTKKPSTIEAVQVTAADFNGSSFDGSPFSDAPDWIRVAMAQDALVPVGQDTDYAAWDVRTNHGVVRAEPGDWILRQVDGEIYPCKDSVFQATYTLASRTADSSGTPALTRGEADAIVETSTAPRVTADAIKAKIASADFFRSGVLTICIIEMASGFTFVGKSACVSAANYDQAAGERYAYDDAFRQIWAFEAYLLREQLSATSDRAARPMAAFAPNYETVKRVEAYPIAAIGQAEVCVTLPNGEECIVEVPRDFFGRGAAVGHMLVRYADGYLSHCPADVFFRNAIRLDPNLVESRRAPVVEAPRVPRFPVGSDAEA